MKKDLIIFDCFGVIFDEIAPVFFQRHFSSDVASALKDKYFAPADLGEITFDELIDGMAEELNMDKDFILEEWESLIHLNEEIVGVIEKLGEKYDLALLSNAPLGIVESLFEKYNLERLFDKIFISCNLKISKPNPEIYKHCVNQFGKNYDKIYMIDDNLKNLEPLPEIGITPIHFTRIEKMLSEIK